MSDPVATPNLANIALKDIRENPVALRTVNRNSDEYLELVESVRVKGIMNPPSARRKTDEESGDVYYELIDGLHRYTACKDAGIQAIPLHIMDMDNAEVLEAQIVGNLHRIKTRPSEYTKQCKAILSMNPLMTESELAHKLGTSVQFVQARLSLTNIENPEIMKLVDDGTICLSNAYTLAKLPVKEQAEFLDRAMTQNPDEFLPAVQQRIKEIKEERRQGKAVGGDEFKPVPHIQKAKDLKDEMENSAIGKTLIKKAGLKTAQEGWDAAIKWTLHMDPESVEAQKTVHDARIQARDAAKAKRDADKAEQKEAKLKEEMKEAADAVAKAKAALGDQKA